MSATAELAPPRRLVLVRHGESEANRVDQFTGRRDSPLTERGREQAEAAGRCLATHDIQIDAAFCSPLLRTAQTCALILAVLCRSHLPANASPALIERDYGALSGLDKATAAARFGAEQVRRWRRSYAEAPPDGESLHDTLARVVPFYLREILPTVMRGTTLVVAHGNSLRALVMALEGLTLAEVEDLELRTGSIRVYTLAADASIAARELLDEALGADSGRL